MVKTLESLLDEYFDSLVLAPALFYSWDISIRFELWPPSCLDEKKCFRQTQERAITLFEHVFEKEDELLLVTDVHSFYNNRSLQRKPLNVYRKYIKDPQHLYKLQHLVLPSIYEEEEMKAEDNPGVTHRFMLPCRRNQLNYAQLLKAISYEDFKHPSSILKNNPQIGYDIYFVNLSKKIIFHMYDDRGCDVLAAKKETLLPLYERFNDWILDYDREEIDRLFIFHP